MTRHVFDYPFFRREAALTGASLGFMLTGLVGALAAADDLSAANTLWQDRAAVHYSAPNEAAIRADLAAQANEAEGSAYTNGLSALGLLAVGGSVFAGSVSRWRDRYPRAEPDLYYVPLSILGKTVLVGVSGALRPERQDSNGPQSSLLTDGAG